MSSLFICGNFFSNSSNMPITQAEELKKILEAKNITVFVSSNKVKRIPRLFDIVYSIIKHRNDYKVINIQFYGGLALILEDIVSLLAVFLNKKLIFTLHGGAIPDKIKKHPKWYYRVLNRADFITCPSHYLIDALGKINLKAYLIENTLPLDKYSFNSKSRFDLNILWMRTFHPIYNPKMALEVVNTLKKQGFNVKLYMAGVNLGYFDTIREKVIQLHLEENIIFPGFLNIEAKNHYAKLCNIYICTNNIDNTPVSLLEMMALGLPIVTTNVGGIPYLIQNDEAILVDKNNAAEMADAILKIHFNPELAIEMVNRAKKLVSNYDEQLVAKKWISLIESI